MPICLSFIPISIVIKKKNVVTIKINLEKRGYLAFFIINRYVYSYIITSLHKATDFGF